MRASISIPGIFPPAQGRDGHFLVDGGILDNLPTDVLRNELHADRIIAVRLQDATLSGADTGSIVGVLDRAFTAGIVSNVDQSQKLADAVINVPVGSFSGTDYSKLRSSSTSATKPPTTTRMPYCVMRSTTPIGRLTSTHATHGVCPPPASCAPSGSPQAIRPSILAPSAKSSTT